MHFYVNKCKKLSGGNFAYILSLFLVEEKNKSTKYQNKQKMKKIITLTITLMLVLIYTQAQHTLTLADVDFDASTGTIKDYKGTATDIIIPESFEVNGNVIEVNSIGDNAFSRNQLKSVSIPNSITTIGSGAFDTNKLNSVIIPKSVTTIKRCTFNNNQLTQVTIPDNLITIEEYAFYDNLLTSITIPKGVKTIEEAAFCHNKLTSVTIPDSLKIISEYSFSYNLLTSVTIPVGTETIGFGAFEGNELSSVTLPNSVTIVQASAFSINQLTSVIIPSSVEIIGIDAFSYNSSLKEIVLPKDKDGYNIEWKSKYGTVLDKITDFGIYYLSTLTSIPFDYNIIYNLDGAVNSLDNPSKFTIESAAITLNEATKDGYTFTGWYTNAEFTGEAVTKIPSGTIGNIELWAKFNKATAINIVKDNSIKINPNPATKGYFVVESKSGNGSVTVYALNGNVVLSQKIIQTTQTIEIPELPNGIYLVKVETENGTTTNKLIIK